MAKILLIVTLNKTQLLFGLFQDPAHRLGGGAEDAKEIMAHTFFSSIDWKELEEKKV